MTLPFDSTIAREKFANYLLLHQERSDKSRYLARAGYTLENIDRLIEDIRTQILPLEAIFVRRTGFGEMYRIDGKLPGPGAWQIHLRTIWLKHALSGAVHFVTLIPQPHPSA